MRLRYVILSALALLAGCDLLIDAIGSPAVDPPLGFWTLDTVNGDALPADVLVIDHPETGETYRIDRGNAVFWPDGRWSMSFASGDEAAVFLGVYSMSGDILTTTWTDAPHSDDGYEDLIGQGLSLDAALISGSVDFRMEIHEVPYLTMHFVRR